MNQTIMYSFCLIKKLQAVHSIHITVKNQKIHAMNTTQIVNTKRKENCLNYQTQMKNWTSSFQEM